MEDYRPRIYFFSPFCLLRNTTNRIFDMRMCDAFAGHGLKVTVVYPYVYMPENLKERELFAAYGMENKFNLRIQYTLLREKSSKYWFTINYWIYFAVSFIRILIENIGQLNNVVIVSREVVVIIPALILKKILGPLCPVVIVPHLDEVKPYKYKRWAYRNVSGMLPVVSSIRDAMIRQEKLPMEKFCVMFAPVADFKKDCSKEEARQRINYHSQKPLVVYTGKVGKGVSELSYIIESAALLPEYQFMFTGGKKEVVDYFNDLCSTRGFPNVLFTGFFEDSTFVRNYQLAADVLVSYYNTRDHMVEFNFPQKLQEYISTGNPVVTPDFEATRDVINESNAFFVKPDNPKSLADGIRKAIENKELAAQKAKAAKEVSRTVTFNYQTKRFIDFFKFLKK